MFLKVYDILGNEVAILITDEFFEEGKHNYTYSIEDNPLSSGLYFYKLRVDNHLVTRKMLWLK